MYHLSRCSAYPSAEEGLATVCLEPSRARRFHFELLSVHGKSETDFLQKGGLGVDPIHLPPGPRRERCWKGHPPSTPSSEAAGDNSTRWSEFSPWDLTSGLDTAYDDCGSPAERSDLGLVKGEEGRCPRPDLVPYLVVSHVGSRTS